MPLTLQTLNNGDTGYIAKHNSNYSAIIEAINALDSALSGATGSALSTAEAFRALFGTTFSIIGSESMVTTGSGSNITVQPGYVWFADDGLVVEHPGISTISFTGQPANTYYINVNSSTGAVSRSTSSTDAIYSVVWTGSAFGTITRIAPTVLTADDIAATLVSTALAATYSSLDARLEAGETKAVSGDLARTFQTGQLSKSVAGSANVALTSTEANNSILRFTGALTGNIDVTVGLTATPRVWLVRNDTTGSFTLTLKGSSGAGTVMPQGSRMLAYHDGTNIYGIAIDSAGGDAEDVAIADAGGYFAGADVEAALQEVGAALGSPAGLSGFAEAVDDRVAALLQGLGLTISYDDAGNVLTITLPAQPFDMSAFYPGIPTESAIVLRVPIARAVTFPANFANSQGKASAAATGSTAFDVQKNGASVGTMTFAGGATSATFVSSGGAAVNFAAGDVLSVVAPGTPDATLANVGLVLAGTR